MFEGDYAQLPGKLVRLELNRGIIKDLVGVFLGDDSESVRVSELMTGNRFWIRTIPKANIARIRTIDLSTGEWPEN